MRKRVDRENRRRRRMEVRFRVAGSSSAPRSGFTEDLSSQGLFIQSAHVLPPGTAIEIEIVAGDESLRLQGEVAWAKRSPVVLARNKRCGMGVKLVAAPPELLALLGR